MDVLGDLIGDFETNAPRGRRTTMKAANKTDLIATITAADAVEGKYTKVMLEECTKAQLKVIAKGQRKDTGSEPTSTSPSKVKQSYRDKYAAEGKLRDRKPTTAAGRGTLNNGDQIAIAFEVLNAAQVNTIADTLLKVAKGFHGKKYAKLNTGMQRMNSGNRIRAAVKRGDITIKDVTKLAAAA